MCIKVEILAEYICEIVIGSWIEHGRLRGHVIEIKGLFFQELIAEVTQRDRSETCE